MTLILKNSIRCKKCADVITSKGEHECVHCKCGAVFIDGGHLYQRGGGESLDLLENLSVCVRKKSEVERKETSDKLIFIYEGQEYVFNKKKEKRVCDILNSSYSFLED